MRNKKAKAWLEGRKNLFKELNNSLSGSKSIIWIHASSAGEFEQAKPVIDVLKKDYPTYKILVTLFSPSGYSIAKKYNNADYVFYLPVDTKQNAARFLNLTKPRLVIFVKYDFWYHHLNAIHSRGIPLLLISSVFRSDQLFFKWYGQLFKKLLHFFQHIFVQDESSLALLQHHKINHSSLAGDTRFDRVIEIAENFSEVPFLKEFINDKKTIVAGSTWSNDEEVLKDCLSATDFKMVLAPHEINEQHLQQILKLFPQALLYSRIKDTIKLSTFDILIIDNVGMLSRLYKYAYITYIGGGFTKDGIHNTLEAAVYSKPVVFGPNYQKYREARELINNGGGFSFSSAQQLSAILKNLDSNADAYSKACDASYQYVQKKKGATKAILNYIQEKRLLTR